MLRYVASRLLYTLPVLWLVVSVVFLLIHLFPVTPYSRCWVKARQVPTSRLRAKLTA